MQNSKLRQPWNDHQRGRDTEQDSPRLEWRVDGTLWDAANTVNKLGVSIARKRGCIRQNIKETPSLILGGIVIDQVHNEGSRWPLPVTTNAHAVQTGIVGRICIPLKASSNAKKQHCSIGSHADSA